MKNGLYDLVVIGGGTGGYSTAIRATELGLKVALVERGELGGTCLNRGCIPTKALLHAASLLESGREASAMGINFGEPEIDWSKTMGAVDGAVAKLKRGLRGLLMRHDVELIGGTAHIEERGGVAVELGDDGRTLLKTKNIVVATGGEPTPIPGIVPDGRQIMISDQMLGMDRIPKSLGIIGGGYIGCEFASAFNAFGSSVMIIEAEPALLPRSDRELSERLAPAFEKRGIDLKLGDSVAAVEAGADILRVRLSSGEEFDFEVLLVAVGRRPVTSDLGLENAGGTTTPRGHIVVDEDYEAAPGLYALGDCIDTLALAHASFAEGFHVAERISGMRTPRPNYDGIPKVAYCFPEVASVGLSEEEVTRRGLDVSIGRFPFKANSRAIATRKDEGFAKIIALADGGPIVGVHLIGPHASELITEGMLLVNWEASAADVGVLHHPHPTFTEAIGEAALRLAGMSLHSP